MNDDDDRSHWPTPTIPEAPVSVKTHGPAINWTPEQWAQFSEWARSLKDYGPPPRRKKPGAGVAKD